MLFTGLLSREDYHKLSGFDGDWRDTWWNDEFLSLMARQWGLERDETRFTHLWDLARTRLAETLGVIDAGTYSQAGGHIHYLVWGRKPTT